MYRLGIISLGLLVVLFGSLLTGCRRSSHIETAPEYQLELSLQPSLATVGEAQIELELTGPDGQPVEGAQISLRGDMTHPGMTPVLAETDKIGDGVYRAAWEWTMAGDWVVTVTVKLPDGVTFERTFELFVASAGMYDPES